MHLPLQRQALTGLLVCADFIKSVVPFANFENANLSDVLMDRAVLNGANLTNANLQRTVLTRSDLGGAIVTVSGFLITCLRHAVMTDLLTGMTTGADITGTDFTNALLDKTQQVCAPLV